MYALVALGLLLATSVESHGARNDRGRAPGPQNRQRTAVAASADGSMQCRELQRDVQEAFGAADSRGDFMRALQAILRPARSTLSTSCEGCILHEIARTAVPGNQAPCGTHDVCVTGDPLNAQGDGCVADVCAVRSSCCRARWDAGCVDLAIGICALDCSVCTHDACSEGRALPESCGDCETLVCNSDPFCCDTLWDTRCVEKALASCVLPCGSTTSTLPPSATATTTTTSTTSTTTPSGCRSAADCADDDPCTTDSCSVVAECVHTAVPGCRACTDASQCGDGKVCTDDVCTIDGTCSNPTNRASCDDGNLCTIGDRCLNGSCIGGPILNCNDGNVCTVDACSAGTCNHFTLTCSDGNACTTDSCDAVTGCAHQAVNCDDLNPCTTDTCDIVQGCRHAAIAGCTP